jgi:hypothetical protein
VIQKQKGKRLHRPELKRLAERKLSDRFTEEFCSLLCMNKGRLNNLTFSLLRKWVLGGVMI